MILYVGDEEKGFFVNEIAKKLDYTVAFAQGLLYIAQLQDFVYKESYKYIFIDFGGFIDDDLEDKADILSQIQSATNSKVVIIATEYVAESKAMVKLVNAGIEHFIFTGNLSAQKEAIEAIMCGESAPLEKTDVHIAIEKKERQEKQEKKSVADTTTAEEQLILNGKLEAKQIGFLGCCTRIGTTTLAFQCCKFLLSQGYTVLYVELNSSSYIDMLTKYYTGYIHGEKEKRLKYITYEKIDMLYSPSLLNVVQKENNYDYIVFDYGNVLTNSSFSWHFLLCDIKVVIGGSSPTELANMSTLIDKMKVEKNISYFYNFCSKSEYEDMLYLMQEKSDCTFFIPYTPNAFSLKQENLESFSEILDIKVDVKREKPENKPNKGLWATLTKGRP